MDKQKYYKWMFLIGGIWNILVAIIGWSTGQQAAMDAWFVMAFGVGFLIVSKDISKNHGIAIVGIIEKVAAFIVTYATVPLVPAPALVTAVDLLFAVLFAEFLLCTKKNP
ncbi:MAG TPA: hypothetical protein VKK79_04810 [Candidatus Lokiarchaeia archaeon]|nr:hypothetical protein [Candidatus Lokiarchaeia archaeon]